MEKPAKPAPKPPKPPKTSIQPAPTAKPLPPPVLPVPVPSRSDTPAPTSSGAGIIGPTPTNTKSNSQGLSIPAIIGIAAGVILLFLLSIFLCKKRRAFLYAKRDFSHDSSRDPINPNDVLPPENKRDQRLPSDDDSGVMAYPMTSSEQDTRLVSRPLEQDPRMQQQPRREHQPNDDQIQAQFAPPAGTGRAQPEPAPILTNASMDNPQSPSLMSPSQRGQFNHQQYGNGQEHRTPRVHQQQQQSAVIVNGMGNQFVLHSNNSIIVDGSLPHISSTERLHDSFDEGSTAPSELSYRQSPARSQEFNVTGARGTPPSSRSAPYNNMSGPSSPNGPRPQPRGGQPGYNNNASPYSSPRQGPSYPSPRPPHLQYQPPQPHPQQGYSQQSYPQQPNGQYGPGPSSPVYPQQRAPYPGGGPVRSTPVSPRAHQRGP